MTWFADRVLAWFDVHGRKDLPWQHPRTPYRVWISEVMLQQTQVATVIPYFERFIARFPNVDTLARAEIDDVLHLWTGLGYYARGRNLHAAARRIVDEHDSELPKTLDALIALPGIGRSTAGAILSAGHGIRASILDGNVKRVLARYFAVDGYPGERAVAETLWAHAEANTPDARVADYTQAIMDLGATLCTRSRPRCFDCPVSAECIALKNDSTDRYPAARPRKALPVRRARMFVLVDAQRTLPARTAPTNRTVGRVVESTGTVRRMRCRRTAVRTGHRAIEHSRPTRTAGFPTHIHALPPRHRAAAHRRRDLDARRRRSRSLALVRHRRKRTAWAFRRGR